jgi:hypothetical protein
VTTRRRERSGTPGREVWPETDANEPPQQIARPEGKLIYEDQRREDLAALLNDALPGIAFKRIF